MTRETRMLSGIILITVPSIVYGGYFLLTILSGEQDLDLTDFQRAMFRAGHAHAGVLVILSLVAQIFVDHARLGANWKWVARIAFPVSAILISLGFFAAALGKEINRPTEWICILYVGIIVLVIALITLGVGLVRK